MPLRSSFFLFFAGKVKVSVYKADITHEHVDVVVNAANDRLQHVGGVAKAILDSGGKGIEKESNKIIKQRGPLRDGDAVATTAGKLPCKKVVHTVGPECRKVGLSQSRYLLRRACLNSLTVAQELKMTSIALPAIGSGIYGMPKDACAEVMFDAVEEFVRQGDPKKKTITDIRFVNIDDPSVQAFRKEYFSRYGNSREHFDGKTVAGGQSFGIPSTDGTRPNRGKNNSRTTVNRSNLNHRTNTSTAKTDDPLSGINGPSSSNTSYSGAVKKSTGSSNAGSPISQESGATDKTTGFYLPPEGKGAKVDRTEEEGEKIILERRHLTTVKSVNRAKICFFLTTVLVVDMLDLSNAARQ